MMLPLFMVAIGGLAVVLRFDGSLRPPRDPIRGFTYTSNVVLGDSTKQQLDGSEKLASCSAAISLLHGQDEKLVAIGGRYLPNVPGMTSADTEYDGLLLGLEWLIKELPTVIDAWNGVAEVDPSGDAHQMWEDPKLIVRGDCKAVIDAFESRSIPRRMETKYNAAMEMVRSIDGMYKESTDTAPVSPGISVSFEHLPRESNTLCDGLCKLVINQKQKHIVESIHEMIKIGEEEAVKAAGSECNGNRNSNLRRRTTKQKRKKKKISESNHFRQALDEVCNNPQLCHSSRLALACELTRASIRQKDAAVLRDLSDFFLKMSRRWSRFYFAEDDSGAFCRGALRKASITCDILSEQCTSDSLQDEELICQEIDSIYEFCVGKDSTVSAGIESGAILDPNSDVSELIEAASTQNQRDLRAWNELCGRGLSFDVDPCLWNLCPHNNNEHI